MTEGFFVDEDAKVVFVQTNKNKTTTDIETGSDKVQGFIESLNDSNGDLANGYFFTISAILENGAAKVVVINDGIDNTGANSNVPASSGKLTNAVVAKSGSNVQVSFEVSDGTSYNGKTANVTFYLLKDGVAYQVGTQTATVTAGSTTTATSAQTVNQNGAYYAVIEVVDGTDVLATLTTNTVNLAF